MEGERRKWYEDQFDSLRGKEILSIEYSENTLRFNIKHDAICFDAFGDCCSSSYIESIDNPEIFKNAIFESVEIVSGEQKEIITKEDGWESEKTHKWSFYKFKTSKGSATLSFRNESNGYYDGHLELIQDQYVRREGTANG